MNKIPRSRLIFFPMKICMILAISRFPLVDFTAPKTVTCGLFLHEEAMKAFQGKKKKIDIVYKFVKGEEMPCKS